MSLLKKSIIVVICLILISSIFYLNNKSVYKCIGDKCYIVDRKHQQKSIEILREIENDMAYILKNIVKRRDCPQIIRERIVNCLNNATLSENVLKIAGSTSFTIDKKDIYLCLKDNNNNYYDKNLLMLVAVHEYSHIICKSQNHTKEFQEINKYILGKCIEMGYYKQINFEANPVNYCGMMLQHNPI